MEAASTSETSVNFYRITWSNIPEDNHHTYHRENLKLNLNSVDKKSRTTEIWIL
jgi:hypothetical protein